MLQGLQQELDYHTERISTQISHLVEIKAERLGILAGRLNALSPLGVLSRGYSIAWKFPESRVLKDSSSVREGDTVRIRLHRGGIMCKVTGKEKE